MRELQARCALIDRGVDAFQETGDAEGREGGYAEKLLRET